MYSLYWNTTVMMMMMVVVVVVVDNSVVVLKGSTTSFSGHLNSAEKKNLIMSDNPERLRCGQLYNGCHVLKENLFTS